MLRILASALCFGSAAANSMYLAQLCRGHTCNDLAFPILDYAEGERKCICRAHPCWDDNGVVHSCDSKDYPFLTFSYDQAGTLSCGCSGEPFHASTYITKDLCPGHYCEEPEFPILDYDKTKRECICRAHPCHDLEGMKHECNDPKFPVLRYREDEDTPSKGKPVCECAAKIEQPTGSTEL